MSAGKPVNNRGRSLAGILALAIALISLASFDWYTISIAPGGEPMVLGTLSGSSSYPLVQALSLLVVTSSLVAFITHGLAARIVLFAISVAELLAAIVALRGLLTADLSAQHNQIEIWTSIASAHNLDALTVATETSGWIFTALAFGAAILAARTALIAKQWPVRVREATATRASATTEDELGSDAISLWESQRKAD